MTSCFEAKNASKICFRVFTLGCIALTTIIASHIDFDVFAGFCAQARAVTIVGRGCPHLYGTLVELVSKRQLEGR
jgi:hypothetical protein